MERSFKDKATKGFLNSEKEKLSQLVTRTNIKAANQRMSAEANKGEYVNPNVFQDLFNSIYKPKGIGMNTSAPNIQFGTGNIFQQQLLPDQARNVTQQMQSALTGLGFGNLGTYEKVDDNNEFEGYEIPSSKKGGKPVFISKDETDPNVIFKGIMQAHGLSTSQADKIFTEIFLPQIQEAGIRTQFGY